MKVIYKTATGNVEIDVNENWGNIVNDFNQKDANAERRYRYHNYSLDAGEEMGMQYECESNMPIPNGYKSFCSDKCRVKWWKKHRSEARKREYKFVCEHCHKEFVRLRNDHPKYCSHACYINERYHKEECDG